MRRLFCVVLGVLAVSGCQDSPPAEQGGKRFTATNGTDVARQIEEYTKEFIRAYRAGDPLPVFAFSDEKMVLSSGRVTNFPGFASQAQRDAFVAQFPSTAGNDVNEAKSQAFASFLDSLSAGRRAGGGEHRGGLLGFGVLPACGFLIYYKPCSQFGMAGLCVNCFATPGGCNVAANAWTCDWNLNCNQCFPW